MTTVLEHRGPALPPETSFAERLRREVAAELAAAAPEDAAELAAVLTPLVETVRTTILCCLDSMANPRRPAGEDLSALLHDRRGDLAGCRPDLLARAYRVGGRVAWRHAAHFARTRRVPAAAVARGAEVIFAYLGELSGLGGSGLSPAPADAARRRLVRLIMAEPAAAPGRLAEAARDAGWAVPAALRVVALGRPAHAARGLPPAAVRRLAPHLVDTDGPDPCLLVDAGTALGGLAEALRAALPGRRAAIGPAAALTDARSSLRVARRALDLAGRGLIPGGVGDVVDCAEHRLALAIFADEYLIAELADRRLAPLRGLTERRRERMLSTLHEWLATQGKVTEMAARMNVHPQTVRYRVHRLGELFGDQLADPRGRFELELAVRAAVLSKPVADAGEEAARSR
ncbi:PucR family transcriptional regulator [Actinokineospora guangxiensis]|uniref:PucR family transcriptional regulator n=1 Tax=Actinokineospora guangxiensis TaxID=1490288 RepID=A0ABW0EP11_9PSEU